MLIQANDIMTGDVVDLHATFTTNHPASSYGQPVMVIEEWGDCMSHQNWVLAGCSVIEASEAEKRDFTHWHGLIDAMASSMPT